MEYHEKYWHRNTISKQNIKRLESRGALLLLQTINPSEAAELISCAHLPISAQHRYTELHFHLTAHECKHSNGGSNKDRCFSQTVGPFLVYSLFITFYCSGFQHFCPLPSHLSHYTENKKFISIMICIFLLY
jgi:hypothetical protein